MKIHTATVARLPRRPAGGSTRSGGTRAAPRALALGLLLLVLQVTAGCTSLGRWARQGFRVGPDYCPPEAPLEAAWIDMRGGTPGSGPLGMGPGAAGRLSDGDAGIDSWWTRFDDPTLGQLIARAADENLSVAAACWRVERSRAQRQVAVGGLFPQTQEAFGSYARTRTSQSVAQPQLPRHFDQWNAGFNLAWELDVWGRFRRGIEASDGELCASVAEYDSVLVLLVAEVAEVYVDLRVTQARLDFARSNIESQRRALRVVVDREESEAATRLDVRQAELNVRRSESLVPALENELRALGNRLCVLLGEPPRELSIEFGLGPIPSPREPLCVGLPAELLRWRPDVRKAERLVAAQSARIGVAEAELYPHFQLNGTLAWQSQQLSQLWSGPQSLSGVVGPSFRWNILHYGRLRGAIRAEEALFQQRAYEYQQTVLLAQAEAESAISGYLQGRERERIAQESVAAATESESIVLEQYAAGTADFNRVFAIQSAKFTEQDTLARVQGDVARQAIHVYRALGGGWRTDYEDAP